MARANAESCRADMARTADSEFLLLAAEYVREEEYDGGILDRLAELFETDNFEEADHVMTEWFGRWDANEPHWIEIGLCRAR